MNEKITKWIVKGREAVFIGMFVNALDINYNGNWRFEIIKTILCTATTCRDIGKLNSGSKLVDS